jgi:hypothetical protein
LIVKILYITVGAQSIAHAQSIVHDHIGDHICKIKLNFQVLTKIKRGRFSSRFLTKKRIFSSKNGK